MQGSPLNDPILDAKHEENCAVLAKFFGHMSESTMWYIVNEYYEKVEANRQQRMQWANARRRGEAIDSHRPTAKPKEGYPCEICGKLGKTKVCKTHTRRILAYGDPWIDRKKIRGLGQTIVRIDPQTEEWTIADDETRTFVENGFYCTHSGCTEKSFCDRLCKKHWSEILTLERC